MQKQEKACGEGEGGGGECGDSVGELNQAGAVDDRGASPPSRGLIGCSTAQGIVFKVIDIAFL